MGNVLSQNVQYPHPNHRSVPKELFIFSKPKQQSKRNVWGGTSKVQEELK